MKLRIRDRGAGYSHPFVIERQKGYLWWRWWGPWSPSWDALSSYFRTNDEALDAIERRNKIKYWCETGKNDRR